MSKQKKQPRDENKTLEEYSEYDDPLIRREIRSSYRGLIDVTQKNKDELVKPESTGLQSVLDQAEDLFGKVRHTREAVLDSSLLLSVTNIGSEQAMMLQTDFVTFEPMTFADKLIEFMSPKRLQALQAREDDDDDDEEILRHKLDSLEWNRLGDKCAGAFRRTPCVDFMLGPLVTEVHPKQRKKTVRKDDKMDASQKVAPQEISKAEEQEEATTKEVERIYGILKRITKDGTVPIYLVKFITDPNSFGRTIENMFHLSFLIKDGKARLDTDNDGLPTVCKSSPYREQDYQESIQHKQIVLCQSMAQWRDLVAKYNIKEPVIPARKAN